MTDTDKTEHHPYTCDDPGACEQCEQWFHEKAVQATVEQLTGALTAARLAASEARTALEALSGHCYHVEYDEGDGRHLGHYLDEADRALAVCQVLHRQASS